ncbi:MAG: histidine kinase dimerization/phospho-acceptor domain-containing protein [Candidatus Manganitrophaceae bacterium]
MIEDLDLLHEIAELIADGGDLDPLFKRIFPKIQKRLSFFSAGAILTVTESGGQILELIASASLSEEGEWFLRKNGVEWGRDLVGKIVTSRKIVFPGGSLRPGPRASYPDGIDIPYALLPLHSAGKTVGVILFWSNWSEPLPLHEKKWIETAGRVIGLGVERIGNAKRYREVEQKIKDLKRFQGEMVSRAKLASGMHEISNSLTSVIGFTQLLLQTVKQPRDREFLDKIFNDAMRCSEIVRNLLIFPKEYPASSTMPTRRSWKKRK